MNWLVWKQYKKQFLIFGLILALFAAFVIPTGMHVWDTYHRALANCASTASCDSLADQMFRSNSDNNTFQLMKLVPIVIPIILGIFLGIPLIAREYSEGTHLLAWTQSVARRKWLTIKIGWILAATIVFASILAALSSWWWRTGDALYLSRFQAFMFDTHGIAPVAYAVFAVALGILLGTLFKRTLLALGVMFAVVLVTQIGVPMFVRNHYMTPISYTAAISLDGPQRPGDAPIPPHAGAVWVTSGAMVSPDNKPLNWSTPPQQCTRTEAQVRAQIGAEKATRQADAVMSSNGGPGISLRCISGLGYHWNVSYQPANRYWKFQAAETALYLALSAAAIAATYWLVLKRDA